MSGGSKSENTEQKRDVFKLAKEGAEFATYAEVYLGVKFTSLSAPKCLCPFHEDKHPSFSVNVRGNYGKCFSCDTKADIIDFTAKIMGITTKEAAEKIVEDLGL